MKIKEALRWANKELTGTREPNSSAMVLLGDVLGISRVELLAKIDNELSKSELIKFKKNISRRKNHEPVWQIIGKIKFWGLDFCVNQDVLVPRPETEFLVQEALERISSFEFRISNFNQNSNLNKDSKLETRNSRISILDIGTGSGAIIISLAHELGNLKSKYYTPDSLYSLVATDISSKALRVARQNAKNLGVEKKINFTHADIFTPINGRKSQSIKYDIICANLPYIPAEDLGSLDLDVHHYEPRLALSGGRGGLEIYERFFLEVVGYIEEGGVILCEIGINQGEALKKIVKKYLPKAKCTVQLDLAEIDRIATIEL